MPILRDMDEQDLERLLNRLREQNEAVEFLLGSPEGRDALHRFVANELALLGFLLESIDAGGEVAGDPGETTEEQKERWIDRARKAIGDNAYDIAKTLLEKLNNVVGAALPFRLRGRR